MSDAHAAAASMPFLCGAFTILCVASLTAWSHPTAFPCMLGFTIFPCLGVWEGESVKTVHTGNPWASHVPTPPKAYTGA